MVVLIVNDGSSDLRAVLFVFVITALIYIGFAYLLSGLFFLIWRQIRKRFHSANEWQGYRIATITTGIVEMVITKVVHLTREVGPDWLEHLIGQNWNLTHIIFVFFVGLVWYLKQRTIQEANCPTKVWIALNYLVGALATILSFGIIEFLLRMLVA